MTSIVGSTISSTIFSANSTSLGLNERTAFFMDNIFAIGFGLSLRLVITLISQDSPSSLKVTGTLVGLWEGIVLLHFTQKWPRSYDPYVAYGVRMFVDLMVTESVPRMVLVAIWTGLGMVLADVGPGVWKDSGGRRIWSRFKRDVKVFGRRMPGMPKITIPYLYRPRTVRFVPSSRSRTSSAVSPTSSVLSGPTYSAVSTATAPTATTRTVPRFVGTPAPSVSSTTTTTSTTVSSVTPQEPTGPTVSIHPPTPGTTPTPRKTRVPGHFMRDSETETEISALPRNRRIPYVGTLSNSSGSASGLTTDNEQLGSARRSKYSFFPASTKKPDLRLTESDSDDNDDSSSTTTETPTPDAGTLRDISMEVVEAAEAEQAEQITPTQSPSTTTHPTLPSLPKHTNSDTNELLLTGLGDFTAPKTPLPPVDQVPDIPDADVDDESWEKVDRDGADAVKDKVEMKSSNSKGKAKAHDDNLEAQSEFSVKSKGKTKSVMPEHGPEPTLSYQAAPQPPTPPTTTKTPEPITPVPPPQLPLKDTQIPPNTLNSSTFFDFSDNKDPKFALVNSEKPEKAMSDPGWLDAFIGKKNKAGKGTKTKSVVSAVSSVAGITDAFIKPSTSGAGSAGAGTEGSVGREIGRSSLSGSATPIARDENKGSLWNNPWGSTNATTKAPSEMNVVTSTVDKPKSERSQRSPPPRFSEIYPNSPVKVVPDGSVSGSGYQDMGAVKEKDAGSVVGGGAITLGSGIAGKEGTGGIGGDRTSTPSPTSRSVKATSTKAPSTRAPSVKALSTVSVSPKNELEPEPTQSQESQPTTLNAKPETRIEGESSGLPGHDNQNETADSNEAVEDREKTEEAKANLEEEEVEEPETDSEILRKDAPASERLNVSLDLLRQIDGLRKILKKGGGGDDKQIAKQIRKYERRVERVSCTVLPKDLKEPNKIEIAQNTSPKVAAEQIEGRMWMLLTNKQARDREYDNLEVTMPKAAKAKPIKSAVIPTLDRHGLQYNEDRNNGRLFMITIPFADGSKENSDS